VAEDDDFPLFFGELVQHLTHPVVALTLHHLSVCALLGEVEDFENVPVIAGLDRRGPFYLPEMIDAEIVGDAHGPGKEFAFLGVTAATDGVDNLDQNVLENVLGKVFVLNQEENGSVQLILVPDDQRFQRIKIAIPELVDKFVVGFFA
jgi:hypothetical protein